MTITVHLNLRSEVESSLTRVDGLPIAELRNAEFVYLYLCICICVFVFVHLYLCICVFVHRYKYKQLC